jgi:hypothetical protein
MQSNSDLGSHIWWLYVSFSLLLSPEVRESATQLAKKIFSKNYQKFDVFFFKVTTSDPDDLRWSWNFKIRIPLEKLI